MIVNAADFHVRPYAQGYKGFERTKNNPCKTERKFIRITRMELIFNSVNSTIANGLGVLKAQAIFLTFGAILNIPLSYILAATTNSWIGIVCANIISYIPVCVTQPVYLWGFLKNQSNMGRDET